MFLLQNPFYAMFAMLVLVFLVGKKVIQGRIAAVKSGRLSMNYFETFEAKEVPKEIIQGSRQLSNLFEIPVLFYTACLIAMLIDLQSPYFGMISWLFVIGRACHSWIHLGSNQVPQRLKAFIFSNTMLLLLWLGLLIASLQKDLFS